MWLKVEANGGEHQREGNGERDDDGAANIAQKLEEDDGNQNHAFGQAALDCFHRVGDKLGTVKEGHSFDALGKDAVVQLLDFLVNAQQDGV
jgi:hypothetical protein